MADVNPTSKAWTYDGSGYPQSLRLSNKPISSTPSTPHTIILRTRAAALNPVDIQLMNLFLWSLPYPSASHSLVRQGLMGSGCDFAGTVLAAGTETGLKPGDEIFGLSMSLAGSSGSLQDISIVNGQGAAWAHKPKSWSWQAAAAIPLVWLTAYTAIEAAQPRVERSSTEKKVVVLGGSSATGMYMVHIAKQRGWHVLATCSGAKADFVKSMGADEVVDYTKTSVPEAVRKFGPAAILDCVGGTECLQLAPRYVTIVGDKTGRSYMGGNMTYWWNPQMVLRRWLGRLGLGVEYDCVNLAMNKQWLEETFKLPLDKVIIDSAYPFDKVKEAFERLNTGRTQGKVVITMDGSEVTD